MNKQSERSLRQQRRWAAQQNAELQKEQQEYRDSQEREYMEMRETIARQIFVGWSKDREIDNLKTQKHRMQHEIDTMHDENKKLRQQIETMAMENANLCRELMKQRAISCENIEYIEKLVTELNKYTSQ